jgi:hypothetical protein
MKVGMKLISEVITSPLMNQLFSTRHEFKLSIYQHHFEIPFPIDRNAKLRLLDMTTTIPNFTCSSSNNNNQPWAFSHSLVMDPLHQHDDVEQ